MTDPARLIKTVFFDMGGTLAHPRPSFNGLLAQVCRREGLDVSLEQAMQAEPAVWARIGEQLDGGRGFSLSPARSHAFWLWVYGVFLEELGYPDAQPLPQRLFETFSRPESYQLFDDALPALVRLREAGFQIGIISNWEAWAGELLIALGLADLIDFTVVSGTVGFEKPDPQIFQFALTAAAVDPPEAMHVGDNPLDDVEGALRVGLRAVLIDRSRASPVNEDVFGALAVQASERRAPLIPPSSRAPSPKEAGQGAPASFTVGSLTELPALLGID